MHIDGDVAIRKGTPRTATLSDDATKELDLLKEGDLVVQSAGTHTGVSGSTDLVKVSIVSNEAEATLI